MHLGWGQYLGLQTQLRSILQLIQFMLSAYRHRLICILGYVQMGYHVLCQSIPNYRSLHCSLQLLRSVPISIALCCHTALTVKCLRHGLHCSTQVKFIVTWNAVSHVELRQKLIEYIGTEHKAVVK